MKQKEQMKVFALYSFLLVHRTYNWKTLFVIFT